jgi:hypothetical protein
MGFLDKIKSAKNLVTGGGAKVQVQVDGDARRGQSISVTVRAQIAGGAMNVSKVYVRVRAVERIEMTVRDRDDPGDRDRVNEHWESFSQEFPVTGPLELEANSQHEWSAEIQLPSSAPATYLGRNANHVWEFQAALDVKGNDPDSGWQQINVS